MKKFMLMAFAMIILLSASHAQFTTVTYDTEMQWFNQGQSLPAEKAMIFQGETPQGIDRVEIQILSSKHKPLYTAIGKRHSNNEFNIPVSFKLRSSDKYDFRIDFFKPLPSSEKSDLKKKMQSTLETYVDVNLTGDKSIELLKKSSNTVKEMNEMVTDMLIRYRWKIADWQPGFSEVVRLKLDQLDKANLGQDYEKGDTTTTLKAVRKATRPRLINELKQQVSREIEQMLDVEMMVLDETHIIDDYLTESKENSLSVNVGYGGVYLSGNLDEFSYGSSPYVGLAFPLGNSVLGSKFLSNSSLTLGFFLENFEDENGKEVTGFLVNRPIYLGLDRKLYKFIRINAGAAFLEGENTSPNSGTETGRNIMIRPYIGLSARIDLSIALGK